LIFEIELAMMSFEDIEFTIKIFHKNGLTIDAAHFLIKEFGLSHPNLGSIELREAAKPSYVLLTTVGTFGKPHRIVIPENLFEFPLVLVLNLIAHEMLHIKQKAIETRVDDKNEREWQAYYEMLFHTNFPLIPEASDFYKKNFSTKGLEYYNRMGEESDLQLRYAIQKREVEDLLNSLA
jgi:hypothetical protein